MLLDNNIAFVCFRKPEDQDTSIYVFPENNIHILQDYNELDNFSGFVFHPFDINKDSRALLLKPKYQFCSKDKLSFIKDSVLAFSFKNNEDKNKEQKILSTSRDDYFRQINKMIKQLRDEKLKKVVLSRAEINTDITIDKAGQIYENLEKTYKSAFVYFLHIPYQCSWLGASPELFFKRENDYCKTVALAATIQNTGQEDIKWTVKEKVEQALVSEYLEDVLSRNGISEYKKNGPFCATAGNLFHLKTEFVFPLKLIKGKTGHFLKSLHATPAVCGLPKDVALSLINETENYDREYYSGFLGVLNKDNEGHLFVNLRCLQFVDNAAVLYVGGGITSASQPAMEWEETRHKARTLLSVIEKIQTFAGK